MKCSFISQNIKTEIQTKNKPPKFLRRTSHFASGEIWINFFQSFFDGSKVWAANLALLNNSSITMSSSLLIEFSMIEKRQTHSCSSFDEKRSKTTKKFF